jgi:hypothetical protein
VVRHVALRSVTAATWSAAPPAGVHGVVRRVALVSAMTADLVRRAARRGVHHAAQPDRRENGMSAAFATACLQMAKGVVHGQTARRFGYG